MKRKILLTIVGALVALLSLLGVPAYADGHVGSGGGGHGGFSGGGHAGFSSGAHLSGGGRAYSGGSSYDGKYYSSGIPTGRYGSYGGYGQRYYAPRVSTGGQVYGLAPDRKVEPLPSSLLHRQFAPVATTSREINRELALPENPTCSPGITREQIAMFASNAPE